MDGTETQKSWPRDQEEWPTTTRKAGTVSDEDELKFLLKDGAQFLKSQMEVWQFRESLEEQKCIIGKALQKLKGLEDQIVVKDQIDVNTREQMASIVTCVRQMAVDFNYNLSTHHDHLTLLSCRMASVENSVRMIACQFEDMFSKCEYVSAMEEKDESTGIFKPWCDSAQVSPDKIQNVRFLQDLLDHEQKKLWIEQKQAQTIQSPSC